jgi:hypothetical protein
MLNFLFFVACYFSGFILAFVVSPVWAFMLYQITYFMNPLERWWSYLVPNISYSFFTVALMGVVLIKNFPAHNQNRLLQAPQFKWIYLLATAYVVATTYASDPAWNQYAATNFVKLVITMSIAYKLVDSSKKLDGVLLAHVAGAAHISFMIYQAGRDVFGRVSGVGTVDGPDTNDVAAAIAPALVLILYYVWMSRHKLVKVALIFAGGLVANGLVLINSRGSFLAAAGGVSYFLLRMIFSKHQRPYQRLSAVAIVVLGLSGTAMLMDDLAIERLLSIREQSLTTEEQTGATRVFFWVAAMQMARDYPFGAGANGFIIHAPEYLPEEINTGFSRNRAVHSSWFEALTEVGYLGLFFAVMLVISAFLSTARCRKALSASGQVDEYYKVVAIESALLTFLIAMTFLNRISADVFYWCLLYTACAYNIFVVKTLKAKDTVSAGEGFVRREAPLP